MEDLSWMIEYITDIAIRKNLLTEDELQVVEKRWRRNYGIGVTLDGQMGYRINDSQIQTLDGESHQGYSL